MAKSSDSSHTLSNLSMEIRLKIESVCERFDKALRANTNPQIEEYLEGNVDLPRGHLVRELLVQEIQYLSLTGYEPDIPSCLKRFPEDKKIVEHAFSIAAPLLSGTGLDDIPAKSEVKEELRYFGEYELLREINRGGMGIVYLARQQSLGRIVAIKMILSGLLASKDDIKRFRTEARATAQLDHPGIVPIYEIGEHEGKHYYSMAYVDGPSLADVIKSGPIVPYRAVEIIRKSAEAVQKAHDHSIIHRDIKPANILLATNDAPRITDFGLARIIQDASTSSTAHGQIIGTPGYMSTEQAEGLGKVTFSSDIYALGATLYALLTGRPPFAAADIVEILRQVREVPPASPRLLNPAIPEQLEAIVMKCLEKSPRARYGTAIDLAEALKHCFDNKDEDDSLPPVQRTPSAIKNLPSVREANQHTASTTDTNGDKTDQTFHTLTLTGHTASVISVAYSPDGKQIVSASEDNTLKVWDSETGQELCMLTGHKNAVEFVAYSPDGKQIVSASRDNSLKIWDAKTREELCTIRGYKGANSTEGYGVDCVAYSPDGMWIARITCNSTLVIFNAENVENSGPSDLAGGGPTQYKDHCGIVYSPDGKRIVSTCRDNTLRIWITDFWNAETGEELCMLTGHKNTVDSVVYSPDGKRIVSASRDNSLKIWDAETGKELHTVTEARAICVAYSPDGKQIVSGGRGDNSLKIWDAKTGRELFTLTGHQKWIWLVSYSPDGKQIVSASLDGTLKIWDAETGKELRTLKGHQDRITRVAYSPDGKRIVSASKDNTLKIWDAESISPTEDIITKEPSRPATVLTPIQNEDNSEDEIGTSDEDDQPLIANPVQVLKHTDGGNGIRCAAISFDGKYVLTGAQTKIQGNKVMFILWETATGKKVFGYGNSEDKIFHRSYVAGTAFSPNGNQVLVVPGFSTVAYLLDAHSGHLVRTFSKYIKGVGVIPIILWNILTWFIMPKSKQRHFFAGMGHTHRVESAIFSPTGEYILTGGGRTTVLWNAANGELLKTFYLPYHNSLISCVAFSPDGQRVAVGTSENIKELSIGKIIIWDVVSGRINQTLSGHSSHAHSIAFSPDGKKLISGSWDNTIILWEIASGRKLWTVSHSDRVESVGFCPNGKYILSGSWDETAVLWRVSDGQKMQTLTKQRGINSVAFSKENNKFITGSDDGTAIVWEYE